jgi:hypothetical protein
VKALIGLFRVFKVLLIDAIESSSNVPLSKKNAYIQVTY